MKILINNDYTLQKEDLNIINKNLINSKKTVITICLPK